MALISLGPYENPVDPFSVGFQIRASDLLDVEQVLRDEHVDVVVVRVSAVDGVPDECVRIANVLNSFERSFRTVVWVDMAKGWPLVAVYGVHEMYVSSYATIGGGNEPQAEFGGSAIPPPSWERTLDTVSALADRDPIILRGVALHRSTSVSVVNDEPHWFANASAGEKRVNCLGAPLELSADDAVRFGVARGQARNLADLPALMGITYPVWIRSAADRELRGRAARRDFEARRLAELATWTCRLVWIAGWKVESGEFDASELDEAIEEAEQAMESLEAAVHQHPDAATCLRYQELPLVPSGIGDRAWFESLRAQLCVLREQESEHRATGARR